MFQLVRLVRLDHLVRPDRPVRPVRPAPVARPRAEGPGQAARRPARRPGLRPPALGRGAAGPARQAALLPERRPAVHPGQQHQAGGHVGRRLAAAARLQRWRPRSTPPARWTPASSGATSSSTAAATRPRRCAAMRSTAPWPAPATAIPSRSSGPWPPSSAPPGITEVKGDLVGDGSYFEPTMVHGDWSSYDLNWWYAAPVSGLSFNDNSVDLYWRPGRRRGHAGADHHEPRPGRRDPRESEPDHRTGHADHPRLLPDARHPLALGRGRCRARQPWRHRVVRPARPRSVHGPGLPPGPGRGGDHRSGHDHVDHRLAQVPGRPRRRRRWPPCNRGRSASGSSRS